MNHTVMPVGVFILLLTLGFTSVHSLLHRPLPLSSGSGLEDPDWEDSSPEEGPFLEGDIVIGSETIPIVEFKPLHRNLMANPRLLWPQKTLYYEFPPGEFHGQLKALVEEALADIMEHSCVRFSPRGQQTTYLKLKGTGKGCNSVIGYPVEEGPLTLQVAGRKCHTLGVVQHEFLHALGLWHEHTRADRDHYVTVVWENVRPDRKLNFVKRGDEDSAELLKLPYDYGSIMHYKTGSFTKYRGSSTLVPRHKGAVKVMGQRAGITRGDIAKLNRLYNCTGKYYTGEDLEGKKFLLGVYYKSKGGMETEDFEEELDLEKDNSSQRQINGTTENTNTQVLDAVDDIQMKGGNSHKEFKNNGNFVNDDEKRQIMAVEKRKTQLKEEKTGEIKSVSNYYIQRQVSENSTGNNYENRINVNTIKSILVNRTPHFKVNLSDDSQETTIVPMKELSSVKKEVYEYERTKRETDSTKPQRDGKSETANQQTSENHESFAPQKILPELLKGVLNTENDRPIVIQFAIYQPIVYKSSNQSESSNEDKKGESTTDKERGKENRDGEKREHDARKSEIKGDDTENRREPKPVKSFQKAPEFDQDQYVNSKLSNKNAFSEHTDEKQQEDDDRIDVRSFNDRRAESRVKIGENDRTSFNYELSSRPKEVREDHYPEHQTEYIPVSKNHDITVSRKEYTVLPHDSHVNGQELRVSQTDYKIESKSSRNHNVDFPLHEDLVSHRDVPVKAPDNDHFRTSDVGNHETSYSHDGREYPLDSRVKTKTQPLKSSHRDSGYESSSLINFSQGKGTKSNYERDDNNNFHHQVKDEHVSHNYHEEEGLSQPPPLELKQYHQEYHEHQERNQKVHDPKDDDIAPNFHEPPADDESTTSQIPTNDDADDNVHIVPDVADHHSSPVEETVGISEDREKVGNVKEPTTYYPKASGTDSRSKDDAREEGFDEKIFKDRGEYTNPNENKSFERPRGNNDREKESTKGLKPPRIRNEEVLSLNTRSQETPPRVTEKTMNSVKKITRPDIVIQEDFSSELDIGERGKKLVKTERKTDEELGTEYSKTQDSSFPNGRSNTRNKNRMQSNVKTTVVRKRVPNTRIEQEEQQESIDEEDLISKPQTSKLNLNPRQALPLKTSVNMGRKTL